MNDQGIKLTMLIMAFKPIIVLIDGIVAGYRCEKDLTR
jgi:hypothetical protein